MVSHGIGKSTSSAAHWRLASLALCVLLMDVGTAGAASSARSNSSIDVQPASSAVADVRKIVWLALRREGSLRSLEIVGDGPLVWTSYRDRRGRLIVELPNSKPTQAVLALDLFDDLVRSAVLDVVATGRRPMSRLVVDTLSDVSHAVVPNGEGLVIELTPVASGETSRTGFANSSSTEFAVQRTAVVRDESGPEAQFGPAPSGVPAMQLQGVDVTTDDGSTTVWIAGDGAFYYSHFRLTDPYRFVVDLIGVVNTSPVSTIAVQGALVDGIRVAQYKPQPELVSRVVIDLVNPSIPIIDASPDGLKLTFTAATAVTEILVEYSEPPRAEPPMAEPMEAERVVLTEAEAFEVAYAESVTDDSVMAEAIESEMAAVESLPQAGPQVDPEVGQQLETTLDEPQSAPTWEEAESTRESAAEMEEAEPAPMSPVPMSAEEAAEVVMVAEPEAAPEPEPAEPAEPEAAEPVETSQEPDSAPIWEEVESNAPTWAESEAEPEDTPEDTTTWDQEEDDVWEAEPTAPEAPSSSLFDVMVDLSSTAEEASSGFETREFAAPTGTVYTGEPMTLSLQGADVKDVLRSFAQISGLNVVVQPGVTGSVTIEFTDVPWDQALDQILKINGLGYQLEGSIMRVAPVALLREEAEEQARLEIAKTLSIPLTTIMRRISYASAADIADILGSGGSASIMSERGSAIVDTRTNTLIIKELPSHINTVIAVIENLDIPEPQVMIEARIIETTKRFSRTLGIQLGFGAVADAAHGNTTGLQFPNTGTADGGVNLLTGGSNGFLGLTLGNVLNTFNLDVFLQAAESEGLINILSAPRITTLNNQRASIQSGLQIPIQTVANNTVSVQFVNATLRLDVTPHVTAEGTVLMDIDIQKREPQLAFAVVGASNAPISTKEASTRVIVRDGGTAVIGGIYQVTSDQGEDRVPGLSKIPILKHLFKNKRRNDENEELLIFITPRVVKL